MTMLYDISPPLTPRLAVWPGDLPLQREILCAGGPVTPSALHATAHLGAHADAPSHIAPGRVSIDQCPLATYLGPCQVIRVEAGRGLSIRPEMLTRKIQAARVLFATGSYPDPERFNEDFTGLSADLIAYLHEHGVKLVGVDTPSVDIFQAKDLPAHQACLQQGVAILEGLQLAGVPEGFYELIALPLRLVGFDGSPVRAVLRTLNQDQVNAPSK